MACKGCKNHQGVLQQFVTLCETQSRQLKLYRERDRLEAELKEVNKEIENI